MWAFIWDSLVLIVAIVKMIWGRVGLAILIFWLMSYLKKELHHMKVFASIVQVLLILGVLISVGMAYYTQRGLADGVQNPAGKIQVYDYGL